MKPRLVLLLVLTLALASVAFAGWDYNIIDNYEDGSIADYNTSGCGGSAGTRITSNPDLVYAGTYSVTEDQTGSERCLITKDTWFSYQADTNYGAFVRVGNGTDGMFFELINGGTGTGPTTVIKVNSVDGAWCGVAPYPTYFNIANGAQIDTNHWYEVMINYHPGTGTMDCYLWDVNGTYIGSKLGATVWTTDYPNQVRMNASANVSGGWDNFYNGKTFISAPTVDFNIIPSTGSVNQPIVFDPGVSCADCNFLLWQFDSDNNVNYYSLGGYDQNTIDGFETGALNANWTVETGTPTVQSTTVKDGSYAVKLEVNDSIRIPIAGGSDADVNWTVWARNGTNASGYQYLQLLDLNLEQTAIIYMHNTATNGFAGGKTTIGTYQAFGPLLTNNTWYGLTINHKAATGYYSYYVLDENGSVVAALTDVNGTNNGRSHFARLVKTGAGTGDANYDTLRTGAGVYVSGSINLDKNETHTFTTTGTKTITLLAGNSDSNAVIQKTILITGGIKLAFYDENTRAKIYPTVTVNGVAQTLTDNELIFTDMNATPSDYNVVAYDANRQARSLYFHDRTNLTTPIDLNVFLLDTNKGKQIDFRFYAPNQTTLLSNARVTVVRRDENSDVNNCGIVLLGASGETSLFLNPDSNYTFNIDSDNDGDSDYNFKQVILTVNIPKDETTLGNITPFHLFIDRLGTYDLNNLTAAKSFAVFANTVDYYGIRVDKPTGTDYTNARYYIYRTRGDPRTDSLTPYLVADSLGGFSSSVRLVDLYNRFPQPNLIIKSTTTTTNGETLVESGITDSTGRLLMSFILNHNYVLEFDTNGPDQNFIGRVTINAQSSSYVFALNISTSDYNIWAAKYVDLNYAQNVLHNPWFDVNFCWSSNDQLTDYTWDVYDDQGNHLTKQGGKVVPNPGASGCDGNTFNYTRPVGYGTLIVSTVRFRSPNFDVNYKKMYSIYSGNEVPLKTTMDNLGENFGLLGTTILAVLIGLSVHGAAAMFSGGTTNGLFLLFGCVAGGFAFMGWIDFTYFVFGAFFSLFAWIYANRGG